jgi:hypothetical protein
VGWRAASVFWFDGEGLVKKEHTYFDAMTLAVEMGRAPSRLVLLIQLARHKPCLLIAHVDGSSGLAQVN